MKDANAPRALGLLRACRERTCRRRAAEQRDELAAPHAKHPGSFQLPRASVVGLQHA
jgi:hypothetical protein